MLTEAYVEALLVDEELADQIWGAWNKGNLDNSAAYFAWMFISFSNSEKSMEARRQ